MVTREALVVDDSRSARFAMRKFLERFEYAVATAEDGAQALQYLQDHRPLVVFLDYLMPGVNGLEVLRALKNDPERQAIPVVICSSVEKPEFQQQARSSGAVEVLPKPPNPDQLQRLLSTLEQARRVAAPAMPVVPVVPVVAMAGVALAPAAPSLAATAEALVPESAERYVLLRGEIDAGLKRLTEDIFVQLSELKAQLVRVDEAGLSPQDRDTLRQMAREEAETLNNAVRSELDLVRQRLDAIEQLQRQERAEVLQAARLVAAKEAHVVAKHTVMGAAAELSHKLTDAISKALGR